LDKKFPVTEEIFTFTINPAVDKSAEIEHVRPESKLYCENPSFEAGGGGINVSKAVAELGGKSRAYYLSGGHTGDKLEDMLRNYDFLNIAVEIEDSVRENFTIYEKSSQQQYRFNMPGPNIQDSEYRKIMKTFKEMESFPNYFVISGSIPPGVDDAVYAELAEIAKIDILPARSLTLTNEDSLKELSPKFSFVLRNDNFGIRSSRPSH